MEQLKNVEIFAVGKHNGDDYSEADLDAIVDSFNALDYTPPLKFGHNDQPGAPAAGWIENVRRQGEKLLADFVDMPKEVYDAIRNRRYNTVSCEIYWNLERMGRKFKRALKAVALLGAEIPAVANLKPLGAMFSAYSACKAYSIPLYATADHELSELARQHSQQHGCTYLHSLMSVARSHPALLERYNAECKSRTHR
jgi:hypothetical protein